MSDLEKIELALRRMKSKRQAEFESGKRCPLNIDVQELLEELANELAAASSAVR